ncbi:STAS domain-containing protein [Zooshikella sp. RANM57]|uniref:STAS domain-containing protein n=1 Tax=Zooshikella sp. RANM57 TaxID=3425863 RepID=UPI003D701E7A
MCLLVSQHNKISVVLLSEQLVTSNAKEINLALKKLIKAGHQKLILDLSILTDIDLRGLSVLVTTHHYLAKVGGKMALLTPTCHVQILIDLTQQQQLFEIYQDKTNAVIRMQEA